LTEHPSIRPSPGPFPRFPGLRGLFVFSDGAFEIEAPDGRMLAWPEFRAAIEAPVTNGVRKVDEILAFVRRFGEREQLEDDFSLLRVEFLAP
jgi:sigma-B regulation protein RsbU (phosphoserine phosphatase)